MEKTNRLLGQIDAEHFLSVLGIDFDKPRNNEINFHCPFSGHSDGDRTASAYMNTESTAWFCHGCHKKGTAVEFAMLHQDVSRIKALQLLREKYDAGYFQRGTTSTRDELNRILTSKPQSIEERQPALPDDALDRFTDIPKVARSYMHRRGFSDETLDSWDIGYDPHSQRITIPVRDEQNRLIGIKGRAIYHNQKPKYLVLGGEKYEWKTYATGKVVFGLPTAILDQDRYLEGSPRHFVVCEGELNAIAVWQAGFAAVALNGSNITAYQEEVLKREADRLTLFFDLDDAGMRAGRNAIETFGPHMPVTTILTPKDAAEMSNEEIARAIENSTSGTRAMLSLRSE